MVSLTSRFKGLSEKEEREKGGTGANRDTANPAANGSMYRASVSTRTSCLTCISASSAPAPPPMFAEAVCENQRGLRSRHQVHL